MFRNLKLLVSSLAVIGCGINATHSSAIELSQTTPQGDVQLTVVNQEISILDYILQSEQSKMGTTALILDDGVSENAIGDSGQFIWLNRFTPDPMEFPFQLEEVSVIFGSNMVNVGDAIEILVYEDTDGDGDPATGSVLLGSMTDIILFNDELTFSVYLLNSPVVLNGPGDVLIGVVNRAGSEGFNDFPAALDQTAPAGRSWAATYVAGDVPVNPALPGDEQWGTIDSFGLPGNWIIRGAGTSTDIIFRNGFE